LKAAEDAGAVLIYRVNSYGGYLDAAFSIGDAIYGSKAITVAYVESKALSAGTLIVLPADIVVAQKGSVLGAMQPVLVNPITGEVTFVNESKIVEPVLGKARIYAEHSGRNASLVEEMVLRAKVVDSSTALKQRLVDYEVAGFDEFLSILQQGLRVEKGGVVYELRIKPDLVRPFSCSLRSRTLSLLSNAYLSNILISIGVLATIFALVSGKLAVLPMAVAIMLLGLVGAGINPNVVSLILITLGTVLLALELFVIPGFGIIGVSGVVLLTLGFALLPAYIPTGVAPTEEYVNALRAFIVGTSVVLGGFFGLVLFKVVEARRKRPVTYSPEGKLGVAMDELEPGKVGFVKIEGEVWRAVSSERVGAGEEVVVVKMRDDGVLVVKKKA